MHKPTIHELALTGNTEKIAILLDKDSSLLNQVDAYNQTAFLLACAYGHLELLKYLINKGAKTDATTYCETEQKYNGYSAVHWAAENGRTSVIACLIENGIDTNVLIKITQCHCIHIASKNGRLDIVKLLLKNKPTLLNIRDAAGNTPVIWAGIFNCLRVLTYLVEMGADLTISTNRLGDEYHGYQVSHWAIEYGAEEVFEWLVKRGIDNSMRLGVEHSHLIHIAAIKGRFGIMKILLKSHSYLIDTQNAYHETPLILAATHRHKELVEYLMNQGADWRIKTERPNHASNGKTAIERAVNAEFYEIANTIIFQLIKGQSKNAIMPYINSDMHALTAMTEDPGLIDVFAKSPRFKNLVTAQDGSNIKISYKPRGRSDSCFFCINHKAKTIDTYRPVREVGKGSSGTGREFKAGNGATAFVKSPNVNDINLTDDQIKQKTAMIAKELQFNAVAYPQGIAQRIEYKGTANNQKFFSYRCILPFRKGSPAEFVIPEITDVHLLSKIILHMVKELQRIHNLKIIHSDYSPANVLIDIDNNQKIEVSLVDFGYSSWLHDPCVKTLEFKPGEDTKWYPPEIRVRLGTIVKPNTNQDVYSLAATLDIMLKKSKLYDELKYQFPSIPNFISKAIKNKPKERPTLEAFSEELGWDISVNNSTGLKSAKGS